MKETRLTVRIPEELHKKLKIKSARTSKTIKDIVTELIEEYLKEEK